MLKIKDDVDLKQLEKYGFTVLIQNDKKTERGSEEFWDTLCYAKVGNHFSIVVENDDCIRQLTIVPENKFSISMCVTWQLDLLYDLIKANLVEKVRD